MVNDSIEEVGKEINEDHFARALKKVRLSKLNANFALSWMVEDTINFGSNGSATKDSGQ